ncbi:hypothetical protein [Sphingomonas sp. G-3-2-10]|uniref:hypothetical protein n=1 Tax=Sphingomonas sp. G-3-2-10 TaxID=2728838 RepID=UPI001469D9D7|nr:hypothetical protein [Sphingomonas sp. G-3-2-10]NML08015.1 hypothetical protein [Sphingomonas sp. G-3-2-10]
MPNAPQQTAVLLWTAENDPTLAAPGDAEHLVAMGLHQRVVRVSARSDEWTEIRFGDARFRVQEKCLHRVSGVTFDVGDAVEVQGKRSVVRDIIWHFRDAAPNYYLAREGKRLSKRYLARDLSRAQNGS